MGAVGLGAENATVITMQDRWEADTTSGVIS